MNLQSELEALLHDILANNKVLLTKEFSDEIRAKYLELYKYNLDLKINQNIESMLKLKPVPWDKISIHPKLNSETVKIFFKDLDFDLLIQNPAISLDFLASLCRVKDAPDKKWEKIKEDPRFNFDLFLNFLIIILILRLSIHVIIKKNTVWLQNSQIKDFFKLYFDNYSN